MSELKAGTIKTPYREGIAFVVDDTFYDKEEGETLFYLKSEADKVIAHNKYKRCLAMAEWCNANCMHTVLLIGHKITPHWEWRIKTNYWYKWRKRWLELAEKFKEAK